MHLKCDLFQKVWDLLLNPEFLHAYEHGIVLKCADGIIKLTVIDSVQPNLLISVHIEFFWQQYSIWGVAHGCFIKKDQIGALGTKADDQWRSHLCMDTEHQQYGVNKTRTWC